MKKQDLPKIIPVFPLSNFIIFPNTTVPLNIFEPRYIEMINDSMKTNKLIGLIQPKQKKLSNIPDLYEVGCLGKISNFEKVLNQIDLIYDFYITKFDKNYTYYQVVFNGTPNNFLKTMSYNDYKFNTQNKIWILE